MELVAYTPALAADFERLNREWIERFFAIEPLDEHILQNPEPVILAKGGEIWFAVKDGRTLGCYALLSHGAGRYEFTKFAVTPEAQGTGAGRALLLHSIERAKALRAQDVIIYSNTVLTRACDMYRKAGWVEQPLTDEDKARYKRVNIKLLLPVMAKAA